MIPVGCDIHIYVEKKNSKGVWEIVKGRNPRIDNYRSYAKTAFERGDLERAARLQLEATQIENGTMLQEGIEKLEKYYPKEDREKDPDIMYEYQQEILVSSDYDAPKRATNWIYDGRNYDLFAILANVRNGYGFAGVDTGDGFIPISMPKDLPNDVSTFVKREADHWDGDGHSHSYLTVKELMDYDWNQQTVQRGLVSEKQYEVYKEKGIPDTYSGDVWGQNIVHISNEQMDGLLEGTFEREDGKDYYTRVSWGESYIEAVGEFYTKTIPTLKELAGDHLEDVRIVFWFDN